MFYFVNLFILLFYSLIYKKLGIRRNWFLLLSAIHIGGIMAFRSCYIGTDTIQYYLRYRQIIAYRGSYAELWQLNNKFPGWAIFFKVMSLFLGSNPNMYMLVSSFFIIIFTWIGIKLFEVDEIQAVILYYLIFGLQAMNATRQNMAMSLVFLAAALCRKRKGILGIGLLLIAISIHSSAVAGVFILGVMMIGLSRKKIYLAVITSFIGFFFLDYVVSVFARVFTGYSAYALDNLHVQGRNVVMQVIYIGAFVYCIWILRNYNVNQNEKKLLLFGGLLCGVEMVLGTLGARYTIIIRENMYFQIFIIVIVPLVLGYKNRYRKLYSAMAYGMGLFYFTFRIVTNAGDILPYETWLI